jgi:CheY-like chemotaxis protein
MAKILVVDDDDALRTAIAGALRDCGHATCEATGGHDAEQQLGGFDPDLVVTDIFMPDGDGLEMIRRLRRARPKTRILAISGGGRSGMMEGLDYAVLLVADRVLPKPFGAAALEAAVASLIDEGGSRHSVAHAA